MTQKDTLSDNQSIDMNISSDSMKHFQDALRIYSTRLAKYADGGETMELEIDHVRYLSQRLSSEVSARAKQGRLAFGAYDFDMSAKNVSLIKVLLPYLIRQYEMQKEERIAEGAPEASNEKINKKIEDINKILQWPIMSQLSEYPLLTKQLLDEKKTEEKSPGVSITANIHNTGSGIIAVGQNMRIQQSFISIEKEIELFLGEIQNAKHLSSPQKEEIEANARTIQAQLGLKSPNKSIVSMAWNSISAIATADGVLGFGQKLFELLVAHGLLG